jgi:hypothetical protein
VSLEYVSSFIGTGIQIAGQYSSLQPVARTVESFSRLGIGGVEQVTVEAGAPILRYRSGQRRPLAEALSEVRQPQSAASTS